MSTPHHLGILTQEEYDNLTTEQKLERRVHELEKQKKNLLDHIHHQDEQLASQREILSAINEKESGDYWAWMPDKEENHLETMADSLPVLIPAGWLQQLLKESFESGYNFHRLYKGMLGIFVAKYAVEHGGLDALKKDIEAIRSASGEEKERLKQDMLRKVFPSKEV